MLIRYSDGKTLVAVLLSLTGPVMRVALKNSDDVAEYRLTDGTWLSEDSHPVTFEFPLGVFEAIGMMPPGPRAWTVQ